VTGEALDNMKLLVSTKLALKTALNETPNMVAMVEHDRNKMKVCEAIRFLFSPLLLLNSTQTPHSLSMSLEQSDVLQRLDVNKAGVLDVSIEHLERFPEGPLSGARRRYYLFNEQR
jgi:hypothetical protein